jgi:hypothetical protein
LKTSNVTCTEKLRNLPKISWQIIVLQPTLQRLSFCGIKRKEIFTYFFRNFFFTLDGRTQFRCEAISCLYFRSVHPSSHFSLHKVNFSHLNWGRIAGIRRIFTSNSRKNKWWQTGLPLLAYFFCFHKFFEYVRAEVSLQMRKKVR